jgi:RNA polymerase sigma factor (sigma-70 family)
MTRLLVRLLHDIPPFARPAPSPAFTEKTRGPTRHYRFRGMKGERDESVDMAEHSPPFVAAETPEFVDQLVENHREFLRYVERRVGNRAVAEEIVQEAFVRSLERGDEIRDSVVGWFYRVLRNAVVDYQRRQAVASRRLDEFATQLAVTTDGGEELANVACACVARLAGTLKPEYADALRRIEVDGVSVKNYGESVGISASNAGVRIFRAREALRKQVARSCGTCAEHGCLDCTCGGTAATNA